MKDMKKILILITIGLFFTSSCNEDTFLEEEPKDDIFAENLFEDYDGFVNFFDLGVGTLEEDFDVADPGERVHTGF